MSAGGVGGVAIGPALHGLGETSGAAWQAALNASALALKGAMAGEIAPHVAPGVAPEIALDPAAKPAAPPGEQAPTIVQAGVALPSPAPADPAAVTLQAGHRDTADGLTLSVTRDAPGVLASDVGKGGTGRQIAGAAAAATAPATQTPVTAPGQSATLAPPAPGQAAMVLVQAHQAGAPALPGQAAMVPAQASLATQAAAVPAQAGVISAQANRAALPGQDLSSVTSLSLASLGQLTAGQQVAVAPATTSTNVGLTEPLPAMIATAPVAADSPMLATPRAAPIEVATQGGAGQAAHGPAAEAAAMGVADAALVATVVPTIVPGPAQGHHAPLMSAGLPALGAPALTATQAGTMLAVDYPGVPPGAGAARPNLARQRRTAPLVTHPPPREPSLLVQDFRTASAAIQCVHYGERRPVPIDIAPYVATAPAWRLDDTEVLVVADEGGRAAAGMRATTLHQALMDEGAGVAALRPGEGFATWEGSPLWLRLAGIDKPAELGVLLAESVPPRLSVMRTGETTWRVDSEDQGRVRTRETLHLTGGEGSPALRDAMLFGGDLRSAGPIADALVAAAELPLPERFRVQEAWAAVARCAVWHAQDAARGIRACLETVARGVPRGEQEPATAARVLEAARQGDPALLGRLRGLGAAVLERAVAGKMHEVGPIEGVALAAALGRLPAWRA